MWEKYYDDDAKLLIRMILITMKYLKVDQSDDIVQYSTVQ